jgi:transcriptional regulator with GAF, ATPase, and Fis domain
MESELFGHEKGAFTGAVKLRRGAFERAEGGTLLLDEIGELPLELQPKLLRVLEARELVRLGGESVRKVNTRVVAATNRDLRGEVNRKAFRGDLYYRLSGVEVRVPPLRERPEDIALLVQHFLQLLSARDERHPPYRLSPDVAARLPTQVWPGNVRELRNVLERTVALMDGGELDEQDLAEVLPDHVPPGTALGRPAGAPGVLTSAVAREPIGTAPDSRAPGGSLLPYLEAKREATERFEGEYLQELLERSQGNVSEAARMSKMDRTHLSRLLRKHRQSGHEE